MTTRRRKKKTEPKAPPALEELPLLDTLCSTCLEGGLRERQRETPSSGATCKFGHGGAPGVTLAEAAGREVTTRSEAVGFEVREGDRLTVMYHGAKLQIAPYSSVELDGGIYSRSLLPGDDAAEQWDRIHGYLERKALEKARAKLGIFADELAKAKRRANG